MLVLVPEPLGWAKAQLFYTELFVKTAGKQTSWSQGLMITEILSEARISNRSHIAKSQLVSANRGFFPSFHVIIPMLFLIQTSCFHSAIRTPGVFCLNLCFQN